MDLKTQLLAWMVGCAAVLLLLAFGLTLHTLREGVAEEMRGADALTELLVVATRASRGDDPEALTLLESQLRAARYRHLVASWSDEPPASEGRPAVPAWLQAWLPVAQASVPAHAIPIGERTLVLRPAPDSEVEEVLADASELLLAVVAMLAVMVACMWWLVQRALAPVRQLQAGLARLEHGAPRADFPPLRLREYGLIAASIDALASGLGQARVAQSRLAQDLITVQERERGELSRELHDELGQQLTALAATVALLRLHGERLAPERRTACMDDLQKGVQEVASRLRVVLNGLRPHGIESAGLRQELTALVDSWRDRMPELEFQMELPAEFPLLNPEAGLALYRSLQEALTNVVRHSKARHVRITLATVDGVRLRLRVADDGVGQVDPASACGIVSQTPGSGLLGLRERLSHAGGHLDLHPNPGGGLVLEVSLPCLPERRNLLDSRSAA